jgi:hypothetical protein
MKHACVVDEQVDRSEFLFDRLNHGLDLTFVSHVGLHGYRSLSRCGHSSNNILCRVDVRPKVDSYVSPVSGENLDAGSPNASRTTCDQCGPARKLLVSHLG